jgi:hypothetical protein
MGKCLRSKNCDTVRDILGKVRVRRTDLAHREGAITPLPAETHVGKHNYGPWFFVDRTMWTQTLRYAINFSYRVKTRYGLRTLSPA